MAGTPVREQSLEALEKANEVRFRRARLREKTRSGRARVSEVLLDPPSWVAGMSLEALLCLAPHIGPARAARLCTEIVSEPAIRVKGLSKRQRGMLSLLLRRYEH